jgi:putative Holliday junction resolvase
VSAAAILADNDTFGAKRKERLDSVSAAVILESFLNWRAHHPDEEPPELVRPEA